MIKKCEHGVYDPHGGAQYCTVCNPVVLDIGTKIDVKGNLKTIKAATLTLKEKKTQRLFEKRLTKLGLGIEQPMTDNSEGEMAEVDGAVRGLDIYMQLRKKVDGSDGFMEAHQIAAIRATPAKRDREANKWVFLDSEVQKAILRSFPDWRKNSRHRKAAGRWARLIQLYYRMEMPIQLVAKEMGLTKNAAKMLLKGIRRVSSGQRFDNRGPLGARPSGRPKSKPRPLSNTL
jgi:hypothetical protein